MNQLTSICVIVYVFLICIGYFKRKIIWINKVNSNNFIALCSQFYLNFKLNRYFLYKHRNFLRSKSNEMTHNEIFDCSHPRKCLLWFWIQNVVSLDRYCKLLGISRYYLSTNKNLNLLFSNRNYWIQWKCSFHWSSCAFFNALLCLSVEWNSIELHFWMRMLSHLIFLNENEQTVDLNVKYSTLLKVSLQIVFHIKFALMHKWKWQ